MLVHLSGLEAEAALALVGAYHSARVVPSLLARNTMSARLKMSSGNGSISGRRHRGSLEKLVDDRGDLIRLLEHQQVAGFG